MEVRKNRDPTAVNNDLKRECREEEQQTNRTFVSTEAETCSGLCLTDIHRMLRHDNLLT